MPWWTVNVSGHRLYMMCRLLKSKLKKPLWVHSIHTLHITCYHKLTITTSLLMFTIEKTKSFFPLFLPLHTWGGMRQRPLEVLKQVEAKNLSSSSASLKKLRPGAVLTSTQFCALEKQTCPHADMFVSICFSRARNWVEVSTAPGPSFLKLFLNFLKLFTCPKQKF